MGSKNCPAIGGIKIVDGKVRLSGSASGPLGLGPLAGGPARISGPARHRRVRETVPTPVVPR